MTIRAPSVTRLRWARTHRAVTALLVAQLPLVVAYGVARGWGLPHSLGEIVAPAVLAAMSVHRGLVRPARGLAACLGLLFVSAMLVHLSHGSPWVSLHFGAMLVAVAAYRDERLVLAAAGFVVAEHLVVGLADYRSVYAGGDGSVTTVLLRTALVAAATATLAAITALASRPRRAGSRKRSLLPDAVGAS